MSARGYIILLALSFPCLAAKEKALGDLLTESGWDVDGLMKSTRGWSRAEKEAALFIANVWNPGYAQERRWRFDAMEAVALWDNGNRQAYLEWVTQPRWP